MKRDVAAILGGGRLAFAAAHLLAARGEAGPQVRHWARSEAQRRAVQDTLPTVTSTTSLREATEGAALVVFAVPARALADVARAFGDVATADQVAVHAVRGLLPSDDDDDARFVLPHEVLRRETCVKKIGALGGPLYFEDAAHGRPVVAVLASRFDETARLVRRLAEGTRMRLHPTNDVVGVELCTAFGLVAAVAAGMAEATGLGATDEGLLALRGVLEAARVGRLRGADPATFAGLAGMGNLIPRRTSTTRRHRELGARLARGEARDEPSIEGALEAIDTVRAARRFAAREQLALPLCEAVDDVLRGARPAKDALEALLQDDVDVEGALQSAPARSAP